MPDEPILNEIEEWARTLPIEQRKYVLWLLEALAVNSSGMYTAGRYCMERELRDAKAEWEKHKFDISEVVV